MKLLGFSLLALLILSGIAFYYITVTNRVIPGAVGDAFTAVPLRPEDPSEGSATAKTTLVYFSSFTCPACRTSALTMDQLRALYGDRLRIIRKDLPLDTDTARTAALAARCAQLQGKFWQYHDALFSHQDSLSNDESIWITTADDLHLDRALFTRCLNDRATLSLIEQDIADAAAAGIPSIPYFELNGTVRIAEDIPLSQWRQMR
jgi:protein-disulfide isomerase